MKKYTFRTFAFGDLLRCNLRCSLNVLTSTPRFAPRVRLAAHPNAKVLTLMVFVALVTAAAPAWASDTVYLKDGSVVEGRIYKRTREEVGVMVNGEPARFFRSQIEKIETDEEKQKKAQLPFGVTPEKRELIIRFLEANGTRAGLARIFAQILEGIPETERPKYADLLKIDEVLDQLLPIYDKYYTDEELKELIRFYRSPTGQKNLELTPQVVVESMDAAAKYFREKTGIPTDPPPAKP